MIDTGAGANAAYGGDGNDVVVGRTEGNTLFGDNGQDTIIGGDGADLLYGGSDNDFLDGGAGNDVFYGGNGDDVIDTGAGINVAYGFGSASDGASVTQIDAGHFSVNSADGLVHEVVTFTRATVLVPLDFLFVS